MTSSLVGSEMCIRDRIPIEDEEAGEEGFLEADQDAFWVFEYGLLPGPVSYTHLTLPTICSV
eukprot:1302553-Prorocentrum_lima.AAC.1